MITDEKAVETEVITPSEVEAEGEQTASPAGEKETVVTQPEVVEEDYKEKTKQRIEELLAQRRQAAEEKQAAIKRAEAAEARIKELENPLKKPERFDFEDEDKYLEALTEWTIESRERKQKAEEFKRMSEISEAEQKAALEAKHTQFLAKVEEAAKEIPDIKTALENVYLDADKVMLEVIYDSPISAELAYYLAKNEKVARSIASLSPLGIAREMGKIEVQIAADKTRKLTTNAPPPITPVGGKGTAVTDDSSLSAADWIRKRNAEEVAQRQRR